MSDKKSRFKGLKKDTSASVDGFVPKRGNHLAGPQYYSSKPQVSGGPRRALRSRQTLPSDELDKALEDVPTIGNFDQPENDVFDINLDEEMNTKKDAKDKKNDKKEKKRGRLRTWWKNRSLKFKIGLIGTIVVLVLMGLAGYRLYNFLNSVFGKGVGNSKSAALNDCENTEDLKTEGDCRFNVLLLGRGGEENAAPDLTDTIIIASVDLKNQKASMVSIPRDTWVTTNGSGTKINAVYANAKGYAVSQGKSTNESEKAGIKAITSVAENVTGVPVHKYVLTDYKAFRDVVKALGGVTVTLPSPIYDGFTGWRFPAGKQKLDGLRALQLARTRHGNARGDFDRNENQRRLLVAMRNKAASTGIVTNPIKLNSLANAVQKNIRTDISVDEAKQLFERTKNLPESKIKSLDLDKQDDPLVTTGMIAGQSVVLPKEGQGIYTKIRAYVRSNMVDPYLISEAPTVAVYNASGRAGLATTVGDVLSSYGYKVLTKETSKTNVAQTLVVRSDKDKKRPFTERFLSQRFKTVISNDLPANVVPIPKAKASSTTSSTVTSAPTPSFIIILGSDFQTPSGPTW